MESKIRFEEHQHFRQFWIWLILFVFSGFVLFILFRSLAGIPTDGTTFSATQLAILVFGMLSVVTIFIFFRLDTIIKNDGIYYRFFPLQRKMKKIEWSKVSKAYLRKYNPILEYGGWGIRFNLFGKGRAYNVSGNMGLQIEFANGKKFLIGTGKPKELEKLLKDMSIPGHA